MDMCPEKIQRSHLSGFWCHIAIILSRGIPKSHCVSFWGYIMIILRFFGYHECYITLLTFLWPPLLYGPRVTGKIPLDDKKIMSRFRKITVLMAGDK